MTKAAADVVIIGSGAGGATTALELAAAGLDVLVLEDGDDIDAHTMPQHAPEMMARMYRHRGMNPIVGSAPLGAVEGCCVGGSTEINSGFWHRTPRETLLSWQERFGLVGAAPEDLAPHFEWAEQHLGVATRGEEAWGDATRRFADGLDAMGWAYEEIPRVGTDLPSGRAGMRETLLPLARDAGARVLPRTRAIAVLRGSRRQVEGVLAVRRRSADHHEMVRIRAGAVVACCGATETPLLLLRSGYRKRIGATLKIHPMLKVAARFDEPMERSGERLPLLQVKQFYPDISLGGAFFSRGHLAMLLGDNWSQNEPLIDEAQQLAAYYVAVKGTGKGSVRRSLFDSGRANIRYELPPSDVRNLRIGLARLSMALLAAGADEVLPGVQGLPAIGTEREAVRFLDEPIKRSALSLTTVHLFSSCPIGERPDVCAADSYGKVHGAANLWINDASMIPDSPGVNPQGTVMALARRNALKMIEELK